MTNAAFRNSLDLAREMHASIGRHTDKSFDWDAFSGSAGFPELAPAQMRGRTRWFRNDGIADATFMLLSDAGPGGDVRFEPA